MDKMQFKEKIDGMIPDLIEGIRKECDKLFDSGGIDPKAYQNDWLLPKIILSVAIENQIWQYKPLSPEGKKEIANLKHF